MFLLPSAPYSNRNVPANSRVCESVCKRPRGSIQRVNTQSLLNCITRWHNADSNLFFLIWWENYDFNVNAVGLICIQTMKCTVVG